MAIALSILAGYWALLIPTIILFAVGDALWEPSNMSMVAESVEEDKRGTAFSLMGLSWFLPGFYAPAIAGYLAEKTGFRSVLAILLVSEFSAFTIILAYTKETLNMKRKFNIKSLSTIREVPRPRFGLSRFYAAVIIDRFAMAVGAGIFFGMLMKTFNYTLIQLGILSNVFSIVVSATQMPMGKFVDRYGRKRFLILSSAIRSLAVWGCLVSGNFPLFLLCHGLFGLGESIWIPAYNAYLSNSVRDEERARFFGDLSGITGLISLPDPIIGAQLYENYGFQGPIMASFVLSLVAFLTLTTIRER